MNRIFQFIPWILIPLIGYLGFQLGKNRISRAERLTAWALINERVNSSLALLEIYERKDEEDFFKFTEGNILAELRMLGNENYAYSEIRTDFFENEVMNRIQTYASSHSNSSIAKYLNKNIKINSSPFLASQCQQGGDYAYTKRHDRIRDLYYAVELERNHAYKEGSFDGSGMLYQSMPSFTELKKICSTQELKVVETLLGPPVYARPDVNPMYKKSKKE